MILYSIHCDLSVIDWTAIGAIVTALMMVATFYTVIQNSKQLRELKRQWDEENRPKIYPRITIFNKAYFLEFFNSGREDACDVDIEINNDFIDNLPNKGKELIVDWIHHPFFIKSNTSVYAFIGFCKEVDELWKNSTFSLEIKGTYNNSFKIDFIKPVSQFIIHTMMVRTPTEFALGKIAEGIGDIDGIFSHKTIQNSLEEISHTLSNIEDKLNNGTEQDK